MVGLIGFATADLYSSRSVRKLSSLSPFPDLKRVVHSKWYTCFAFCLLLAGCAGLYGFVSEAGWIGPLFELLQGHQRDAFMQVILGHGLYTFGLQLSLIGWALICTKWIGYSKNTYGVSAIFRRALQLAWFLLTLSLWVAYGERSAILAVFFVPFALWLALGNANDTTRRRETHMRKATAILVLFAILFIAIAGPIGLYFKGMEVTPAAVVSMAVSALYNFDLTMMAQ